MYNIVRSAKNGKYGQYVYMGITAKENHKTYFNSSTIRVAFSEYHLSKYSLHINPLYSFFMNMNYTFYALYDCETRYAVKSDHIQMKAEAAGFSRMLVSVRYLSLNIHCSKNFKTLCPFSVGITFFTMIQSFLTPFSHKL